MHAPALDRPPRDASLFDELRLEDHVEMTNLFEEDTGVAGVIFISTRMASHGPRIKFMLKAGDRQPSASIALSDPPRVVASSLPARDLARASPDVLRWAALNREALLRFWDEGTTFSRQHLNAFVEGLARL